MDTESNSPVTVHATLNILHPTETFTPRIVAAELVEISDKSIRLRAQGLSAGDCAQLMETKLVSKIALDAPGLDETLVLKAMVFWAKHVVVDPLTPPYADLGFNFRPPNEEDAKSLAKILELVGKANG